MKILVTGLLIISVIFVIIIYFLSKSYKKIKLEYKNLSDNYDRLSKEFQKLLDANKIKEENKEEADEKINNLHNGNAVDNAINILCKH